MSESTSIQQIPLNRLSPSSLNVRKKDRKADIDALAASILAHGLLQNLNVVAKDEDKFEVVAGGRRLAALKALVKAGAIARDYAVPCKVVPNEQAREASLAENIQRVDMDAMDEVDAYGQLVDEGASPEDVARRFGVTLRHVQQRLALASLSPKIKTAWKRGDITLDAARAFCLAENHAQQDAVFRTLGKPVTHASSVRARLMEGQMRASDRLVRFVGIEAYEARGGAIRRDLFDTECVFIENPALIAELASAKIGAAVSDWAGKGWGWVETTLDGGRLEGLAPSRLQPEWRDPTPEETVMMQQLQEQIDALDTALEESSIDDDPRWSDRDDLEGAYETIRQNARGWNAEMMKHAGVLLGVDHGGALIATEGLVRKADQKVLDAMRRQATETIAPAHDIDTSLEGRSASVFPKALARQLTSNRTEAIRSIVSGDPRIALAICVAALGSRLVRHANSAGIGISVSDTFGPSDGETNSTAQLESVLPDAPADILAWCLAQDCEALLTLMAGFVARGLDLAHEDASPADKDRQTTADILATALALDMTAHWSAHMEYWLRLSKARLLEEYEQAPGMQQLSDRARLEKVTSASKMKKDDLALRVDDAWRGHGYLPELLITPLAAGSLAVCSTALVAAE